MFSRDVIEIHDMLCDVISAVTEFMVRVLHSRDVIEIHDMLCDVISVVTGFMVRALHSWMLLKLMALLRLNPAICAIQ